MSVSAALEQVLIDALAPAWRDRLKPVVRAYSRFACLDRADRFVARSPHLTGLNFVDGALAELNTSYLVDERERQRIPDHGPLVVVCNHPLGGLDALAAMDLIGRIRPDLKVLGNDVLSLLTPLLPLLIPVRVFGNGSNREALRIAEEHVSGGGALLVFPAGEVSRIGLRGLRDRPWRAGFIKVATAAKATLLPLRVRGHNSAWFYLWSALLRPVSTALLPRELLAPARHRQLLLRVGLPLDLAQLAAEGPRRAATLAQSVTEGLGRGRQRLVDSQAPLAAAECRTRLKLELQRLTPIGRTPEGRSVLVARGHESPMLMRELARLRERSFRAVGEGTGNNRDWDAFDADYDQLVLYDERQTEIIGAYRIGPVARLLAERGPAGLYSTTLFDFTPDVLSRLDDALELGRSFVVPEHWGSRALDELWCGIGAYLRAHPEIQTLFGPVSISAALSPQAVAQLVGYYQHYYGVPEPGVRPRSPFAGGDFAQGYGELDADQSFRVLKANLERLGAKVPTLYKQYTELCEPGGVRFVAFNVDRQFQNCVDGLVFVDLARLKARKRARYLGLAGTALVATNSTLQRAS